ncbi:protein lifeguard 3 [Alligator sinensis]|uniref:Protein lifeguard 3 n=1 Tax=Alligator sinensis TaxID=38654 RepID=A0A1U7S846_ALLSI|nr:protein lifeguard 3 [Alligator sinensis]
MSHPQAPPPYDKDPLYPTPPGGYPQPGGYSQPGGYPPPGGYSQPGGYPPPAPYGQPGYGYPPVGAPVPPMPTLPMNLGDDAIMATDWEDKKGRPARRYPWNIILLAVFTLAMGFMTGTISSWYGTKAVFIAMIITAIVAIVVTVFCFQTKVDFTSCTGLFCVLGIVITVTGIVTAIVLSFKYVSFLAYDTQLVLGNRKQALGAEEYVYGALRIYTDIMSIFTSVLQLVGRR